MVSSGGRHGDYPKSPRSDVLSPASGSFFVDINMKRTNTRRLKPSQAQPAQIQEAIVTLVHANLRISDGDLLLFRRRGVIAIAGRGTHSHAAKAAWWDGELFC